MKTYSRIIIVLAVLNLVIGSFAFAQKQPEEIAPPKQPAPQVVAGAQEPFPAAPPAAPMPPKPPRPVASSQLRRVELDLLRPDDRQKVLVIPAAEVKKEELAAIMEDMQVMSHILDKRFKGSRQVEGVFLDFGDFFGRDSRVTQAIYLQGYGALFLMEWNFPLSPSPKEPETKAEKAEEPADTVWESARQEMFSPQESRGGPEFRPGQEYDAEKVEQLKRDLVRTLKHAANIRNLKADEWIILSVTGADRQAGEIIEYKVFKSSPTSRQSASSRGEGRGYGGYGGGMGGYGGFGFGIGGFGREGFPSSTVLTIRAKKSDVDAFAKGELDFEQFQKQVKIIMY